ncbi:hypothetical protein [Acanthopleuribacter pedis]|uniref:Uncharacterized protein n=1 Tax=Acanthopleuribacter pedis TaxID=442870 RepID=A0A8J7QNT9_9BACT|nr:hypothetical protein [Acanthopleuribacter pedis]MBO1321863.1 hypothetical protein [Acanthopleuribacter pedis]
MFSRWYLVLLALLFVPFLAAQDQVTVKAGPIAKEVRPYVFWMDKWMEDREGRPVVKVQFKRVLIVDGQFQEELRLSKDDRAQLFYFLKENFRLYRGNGQMGVFKYRVLKGKEKPKRGGIYLAAIPMDNDALLSSLREEVTDEADLFSLLEMDVSSAMETAEKEDSVNDALEKAKESERGLLTKRPGNFFVAVK